MGDANRRKKLDPTFGKPKSQLAIQELSGEALLKWTANDFKNHVESAAAAGYTTYYGAFSPDVCQHLQLISEGVEFSIPVTVTTDEWLDEESGGG